MTEEHIFDLLAAHGGPAEVDAGFEHRLFALLQSELDRPRRSTRPMLLLVAALVALLAISAAVVVGTHLVELPPPDRAPTLQPSPTAPASSSEPRPIVDERTGPTRRSFLPGVYWWRPVSTYWMHNPTSDASGVDDSVGVELILTAFETDVPEPGGLAALVAGYAGTYRAPIRGDVGTRTEVWIVQIRGIWITVTLREDPAATNAEVAEGRRIVQSLRMEPWSEAPGWRLFLTLPDGWDNE